MHAATLLFRAIAIVWAHSLLFHCPIMRHLVRAAYRYNLITVLTKNEESGDRVPQR